MTSIHDFIRIPRIQRVAIAPGGDRLLAEVAELDADGASWVTHIWAVDPEGAPARRLTEEAGGARAAWAADGSLLFVSERRRRDQAEAPASLWALPPGQGEARALAAPPGGVTGVAPARHSSVVVVAAKSAPGSPSVEEDRSWWEDLRRSKVSGVLYDGGPVRHWDHHLGPHEVHLYAYQADGSLRDVTPGAAQALHDSAPALGPDGTTVVVDWLIVLPGGRTRRDLVAIDVATGERRTIASDPAGNYSFGAPTISPDGAMVAAIRTSRATRNHPPYVDIWLTPIVGGPGRAVRAHPEARPGEVRYSADSRTLVLAGDWRGHRPVWTLDPATGATRLVVERGAFSGLSVADDGRSVFAVVSAVDQPPAAGRLDLGRGHVTRLAGPPAATVDARLEEVTATAADGTGLRAWLALPPASEPGPHPTVLWVHGGPLSSWNEWHWRWNPWLMTAEGWAVLLPDPALSTGYGDPFVRRAWTSWAEVPYSDLMALADAALARPDLDERRTAVMGGSYGGFMTNWIIGHTDRFGAAVTHSGIWNLEQFQATSDLTEGLADSWGRPAENPNLYRSGSADRYVAAVRTPTLVVHGEDDYRVPVTESLRMWNDLRRHGVDSMFLWFGHENHWVLRPQDSVAWYETVLAFLATKVLERPWRRPGRV